MTSTDDILKKYGAKIERQMGNYNSRNSEKFRESKSYSEFKKSLVPELTRYERWCKSLGNSISFKVGEKDKARISRSIEIAHLNVTPGEVVALSAVILFGVLFGGILLIVAGWLLFTEGTFETFPLMLLFLIFMLSIFLFAYSSNAPQRLAMKWRLKASSQMVPAILYIVIYMKHTSNLEKAISFAAEHLKPPLADDFRKIFWDVEVGRFSMMKDSLDNYLNGWKDYSIEFIEAFHLIESSLYEPEEARRVEVLEKSLQVILEGVYDKMLKYTHDVKAPLTNVYMLGIVLPTLALAILPLASTMLGGAIKWFHVLLLFNILIPFAVIYLTGKVLMQRPGGYGNSGLIEKNPLYSKYLSNKAYIKGILLAAPLFFIGLIPFFMRYTPIPNWIGIKRDYAWSELGISFLGNSGAFGIISSDGTIYGPSGALSLVLSLFIPLAIAIVFIVVYKAKTKELIIERDKYKDVEREFTSSLFQLGNRIGDGFPAEIAFAKTMDSTKGTATEGFFRIVNENIQQLGMSLERALFDSKRGAVIFYPSEIVATSMRVLVESVKKGLKVAARSLMSISEYVKNIKKINDRLNDLLAEILSDMKANMTFLAPLLSGIIVGLAGMITGILGSLGEITANAGEGSGIGGVGNLLGTFDVVNMIPTYWLQIVVGIYLIQIVFILTSTLVTIKSGRDELEQTSETSKNLKKTMILYFIVALISIIALTLIGAAALSGLG
ncbi:MAG: hypothetical protein IH845_05040 [Nanoarchaeota archaeon]|nr:hypothetical protein [Nanoarchaeota archaeon]